MADGYQYISSSGVIVADTADTLADVQAEFKAAFGEDLIVTPNTPQGTLITAEVLARDDVQRNNAVLANQINPNLAGGVFLDAIMALTGSKRTPATKSEVTATLTGAPSTIIPEGAIAQTTDGDQFALASAVIIPLSGTIDALFYSVEFGPIPAAVGALNAVVSGVLGWETVTNAAAAIPGQLTQSDQAARALRRNTLAIQGQSVAEAITSGLYTVEGVKSLQFRENVENTTQTIDGISLVAHSVWSCVDGGTDLAVASMLLRKKSGGANWNGDVEIDVLEAASGQTFPVKFDRPDDVNVQLRITIRAGAPVADPVSTVRAAVMTYVNGDLDGEPGFAVGESVSPYEIGGAVNRSTPPIFVTKVEVSLATPTVWSTDTLDIALNEIARISEGAIAVVQV